MSFFLDDKTYARNTITLLCIECMQQMYRNVSVRNALLRTLSFKGSPENRCAKTFHYTYVESHFMPRRVI